MRLYCSFPGNLGLLWSKGDHCLLGSQWQVLGALEGQSLGYYERPHFPRLITASLFHIFRKSGPYVLIQDKPCFFIKLILLNSQEMLPKKKKNGVLGSSLLTHCNRGMSVKAHCLQTLVGQNPSSWGKSHSKDAIPRACEQKFPE